MNNLTPLGLTTCFIFSVLLSGTSFDEPAANKRAYVVNQSSQTIYYKPESFKDNPGFNQEGAYPIAPGETLYAPIDAIVTSATPAGKIFRIPTGGTVVVNQNGMPEASNLIARTAFLLPAYGITDSPCESFATLSNSKRVLIHLPDIIGKSHRL